MVAIAKRGLVARGLGEEVYLAPLEEIAATGRSLADKWLERASTAWDGDVSRLFTEGAL
jgi:glutamate--cysteine ligase